jgi:hypothetical protein
MPTHWTYDGVLPEEDLLQGDIIGRTSALDAILKDAHQYFLGQQYTAFLVVTQSCDLVKRGRTCKAEHIGIAVVRELEPILPALMEKVAGFGVRGLYRSSARPSAIELLKKIINQNEMARGFFYLHPDADVKIATPSVAFLRVAISLRNEHYEVLREARCGRLSSQFRNKLGWLCGNLFSRIDTEDWDEATGKPYEGIRQATSLLEHIDGTDTENWIPQRWIDAALRAKVPFQDKAASDARSLLKQHAPLAPLEAAIVRVRAVADGVLAARGARQVQDALKADPQFRDHLGKFLGDTISMLAEREFETRDAIVSQASIVERTAAALLPAIRAHLEARSGDLVAFETSLRSMTITKEIAQSLRSITQAKAGAEWEAIKPKLSKLDEWELFNSDEIIQDILARVQQLDLPFADIDTLVKRLRNDNPLKELFAEPQPSFMPESE